MGAPVVGLCPTLFIVDGAVAIVEVVLHEFVSLGFWVFYFLSKDEVYDVVRERLTASEGCVEVCDFRHVGTPLVGLLGYLSQPRVR